ncbi:small acid-soluble spore protein [Xylanibacillus composti]|uniref:Small acid-soluble spore protein alpha/beta type n=1 Tax=Xylanibacillus composti TaxID=1572762 RepID=A0A8J4H8T5_9BACL|nr:alpha/beta-type small acid-soluble spore protein [Xylanibacillus composti]MDT9725931.1 small acid-soluble spore protein [Xylanibacillus composti]GIQ71244.1 hypothetical protein XYCOK13_40680 [Xylanibacillus composti]
MGRGQSGRPKVVPESHAAIDQLKYEIAAEIGLPVGPYAVGATGADTEFATELGAIPQGQMKEDYWGHIASRDAGFVGGTITARLVRRAEETLLNG